MKIRNEFALPVFLLLVFTIAVPLAFIIRSRLILEQQPKRPSQLPPITQEPPTSVTSSERDPSDEDPIQAIEKQKSACLAAAGRWNDCGSPCRNQKPGEFCILVCVAQCECGGAAGWQCPAGTACTDFEPMPKSATSTGVCRPIME